MGVRGLTAFVENNQRRLLEKDKLHNCSLVIDGFGLLYHLYFGGNLDSRHGGEFAAFASAIDKFFNQLSSCKIRSYVIFDGPIEPDKLPCVLSRLQDRIRDVSDLVKYEENSRSRMMPLFAVDVLIHYLLKHQISFAVSLVEADSEIATVANSLDCPVLSADSDYYIYNLRKGYIQFQNLNWEHLWWDKGRKSIVCYKYKVSSMRREYGISVEQLPYLSILLGNDWIPKDAFATLVSKLPQARSTQRQKRRRSENRIDTVMWWLSTKTNENSLLEKLRNSLPKSKREEIMGKVASCLDLYRNECDATATMEILKGKFDPTKQLDADNEIEHLVRTSNTHPIAINILCSKYACMPVIMSDPRRPSPHSCATEIRTLFYRVLLRRYRFKTAGPEFLFLQEYDKVEQMYKKSKTISIMTSLCPMCDAHHDSDDCTTAPSGNVKTVTLVLKLLQLDNDDSFSNFLEKNGILIVSPKFLKILDIVMTATLFWFKKTSPKPTFVCALLVMIAWSIWKRQSQDITLQKKSTSTKKFLKVENSRTSEEISTKTVVNEAENVSRSDPASSHTNTALVEKLNFEDRNNTHSKNIDDSIRNTNESSLGNEKIQDPGNIEDSDSVASVLYDLLNQIENSCVKNSDTLKIEQGQAMDLQCSAGANLDNIDEKLSVESKNLDFSQIVQNQPMELQSSSEETADAKLLNQVDNPCDKNSDFPQINYDRPAEEEDSAGREFHEKELIQIEDSCRKNLDFPPIIQGQPMDLQTPTNEKIEVGEKFSNTIASPSVTKQDSMQETVMKSSLEGKVDNCNIESKFEIVLDQSMESHGSPESKLEIFAEGQHQFTQKDSTSEPSSGDSPTKLQSPVTPKQKPSSGGSPTEQSQVSPKQKILKLEANQRDMSSSSACNESSIDQKHPDLKSREVSGFRSHIDITNSDEKITVCQNEGRKAESCDRREETDSKESFSSETPTAHKNRTRNDSSLNEKPFSKKTVRQVNKPKIITVEEFVNHFGSMTTKTASGKIEHIRREFDVDLLHSISEWLCIVNAALLLHHMVEGQRSNFAMQDFLTSNILLHEIHARIEKLLKTSENMQNDIQSISALILGRLQLLPEVQTSFKDFINFLIQHQ